MRLNDFLAIVDTVLSNASNPDVNNLLFFISSIGLRTLSQRTPSQKTTTPRRTQSTPTPRNTNTPFE
jgi:hypothetical protein